MCCSERLFRLYSLKEKDIQASHKNPTPLRLLYFNLVNTKGHFLTWLLWFNTFFFYSNSYILWELVYDWY